MVSIKALDSTVIGASFLLATIGFLITAVSGDREPGSHLFMVGFSTFCLYSVVSSIIDKRGKYENPMQSMGGKLSIFGFGLAALAFSLNFFLDISTNLIIVLVLVAFICMAVGVVLMISDHF